MTMAVLSDVVHENEGVRARLFRAVDGEHQPSSSESTFAPPMEAGLLMRFDSSVRSPSDEYL
jgi:hypothetical protein